MNQIYKSIIALLLIASLNSDAMLHYAQPASLFDHMVEVNKEWLNKKTDEDALDKIVSFNSEDERIRTHLQLVINSINENTLLSENTSSMRLKLMNQLSKYADEMSFPSNTFCQKRNPVFIDDNNVHCAVGFLMNENGFHSLAQFVHDQSNLAYIKEIPANLLEQWKTFSQLSIEEMAWIQPGYPPTQSWTGYGENFDGVVNDVIEYNDEVFITGSFQFDETTTFLAKFVGDQFVPFPMATGLGNDLEIFEDKLYIAGSFNGQNLAIMDDEFNITYETVGVSKGPYGYCLLSANDKLYFSADASGFAMMSAIHQYDGNNWAEIGSGTNPTYDLEWHNGKLIAAGEPGNIMDDSSTSLNVAQWDGAEWAQVGTGINETVNGIMSIGDTLAACGKAFSMGEYYFGVGLFAGNSWNFISEDSWSSIYPQEVIDQRELIFNGFSDLGQSKFIYGKIPLIEVSMVIGSHILEFQPEEEWILGPPVFAFAEDYTSVNCMVFDGQLAWAGGHFFSTVEPSYQLIASSPDFVTGVDEITDKKQIALYPNPANESVTVQFAADSYSAIQLFDCNGQLIFQESIRNNQSLLKLKVNDLHAGVYCVQLENESSVMHKLLVVN